MQCVNCHNIVDDQAQFCPICGTQQQPPQFTYPVISNDGTSNVYTPQGISPRYIPQSRSGRKRFSAGSFFLGIICSILILAIVGAILLFTGTAPFSTKIEGGGFNTPEAAAEAYLNAFARSDYDAMLKAFAVETFVKHYNLEAEIERAHTYSLYSVQLLPPSSDLTLGINQVKRLEHINKDIFYQYMFLCVPEVTLEGSRIIDDSQVSDLIRELNNPMSIELLSTLKITGFVPLAELDVYDTYHNDGIQRELEKYRNTFGADEVEEVVASVDFNGTSHMFCFTIGRFGTKWYLLYCGGGIISQLMGASPLHAGIVQIE